MDPLDSALDDLRNIATGAWLAHPDLFNRIPYQVSTSGTRVTGTSSPSTPSIDREVRRPYMAAMDALKMAFHRAKVFGCTAEWSQGEIPSPYEVLYVCNAIRQTLEDMPVSAFEQTAGDLATAAKKLKPWWRKVTQPRQCKHDACSNLAAPKRWECHACQQRGTRQRARERQKTSA